MYVCMYVCIYVSQGDFRLMSFTAGRCGTPLIPQRPVTQYTEVRSSNQIVSVSPSRPSGKNVHPEKKPNDDRLHTMPADFHYCSTYVNLKMLGFNKKRRTFLNLAPIGQDILREFVEVLNNMLQPTRPLTTSLKGILQRGTERICHHYAKNLSCYLLSSFCVNSEFLFSF